MKTCVKREGEEGSRGRKEGDGRSGEGRGREAEKTQTPGRASVTQRAVCSFLELEGDACRSDLSFL